MSQWLAWAFQPSSSSSTVTLQRPKAKSNQSNNPTQTLPTPSAPPMESTSTSSPPSIRELSSAELSSLEKENKVLRQALDQLKKQIEKQSHSASSTSPSAPPPEFDLSKIRGFVVSGPGSSSGSLAVADQSFVAAHREFEEIRKQLQSQAAESRVNDSASSSTGQSAASGDSSSSLAPELLTVNGAPVVVKNMKFKAKAGSATATGIEGDEFPSGDDDGEPVEAVVEEEVAVVDLSDSDWWTMVNPTDEEDAKAAELPSRDQMEDDFVVLNKADTMEALADFISKSIQRHYPEAARLPPDQLRRLLDGTFHELKEPGKLGKAWQWGKFMYSTYGWGTTIWNLYREPAVVKLVASGVYQAATWILVLVL